MKRSYNTMVPSCTRCRRPMKLRIGKYGTFYGCKNYPRCRATVPVKEYDLAADLATRKIVYETKLYQVNGEIISRELAKVVPIDHPDED